MLISGLKNFFLKDKVHCNDEIVAFFCDNLDYLNPCEI